MAVSTLSSTRAEVAYPEKRVTLAFLITRLVALLVGALLGPLQAPNYAGINVYGYFPFLQSYYQGLTLHGVLNALVFTTFFISGLLLYLPARELDMRPDMNLAWGVYWTMLAGLVLAGAAVISNTSSVLYTFYLPLKGHWAFCVGLSLVVVASTAVGFEVIRMRVEAPQSREGHATYHLHERRDLADVVARVDGHHRRDGLFAHPLVARARRRRRSALGPYPLLVYRAPHRLLLGLARLRLVVRLFTQTGRWGAGVGFAGPPRVYHVFALFDPGRFSPPVYRPRDSGSVEGHPFAPHGDGRHSEFADRVYRGGLTRDRRSAVGGAAARVSSAGFPNCRGGTPRLPRRYWR